MAVPVQLLGHPVFLATWREGCIPEKADGRALKKQPRVIPGSWSAGKLSEGSLVVWKDSCQGKEAPVGMEPLKTLRWRGWHFYNVPSLVSTGAAKRVLF